MTPFCLYAVGARDLHAFPTRRSSDLTRIRVSTWVSTGMSAWLSLRTRASQARSEEHTSELQSRGHLVCRLLLEKKKYQADDNNNNSVMYVKHKTAEANDKREIRHNVS